MATFRESRIGRAEGFCPLLIALLGLSLLLSASSIRGQRGGFTLDFETGDLRGWIATGGAFRCQPTFGDNPTARNRGQPSGHQGQYWIGTFECYQGRSGQPAGAVQGDEPQGTLTSAPFTIPQGTLSFLIGGGGSSDTRVELLVGDPIEQQAASALQASGENVETMRRVSWNLDPYAGKTGQIRIVDQSSGPWGHINADDFRFEQLAMRTRLPKRPVVPEFVQSKVPDLRGRTVDEAKSILEPGLKLGQVEYQLSRSQPDTIVSQRPAVNEMVVEGTAVDVVVARGVVVPNLQGLDPTEAQGRLGRYLQLGAVRRETSNHPVGKIFQQDPKANSNVPLGTRVNVTVAQGVRVPDLSELSPTDARTRLRQVALELGAVRRELSTRPVGTIVRQDPEPGTEIPVGSSVQVVVAQGVVVPDIRGFDIREARRQLQLARLQAGKEESEVSPEPVGTVLQQDPGPGVEVPLGTQVGYTVARGISVPDLTGMDREQAGNRLQQVGLRLGNVETRLSAQPVGTLVEQSPEAGSTVPLSTSVNIIIGQGVAAPDLHGQDIGQANEQLNQQGLRLGPTEEELSTSPVGTVVRQDPLAGTVVPLETPVRLALAQGVEIPNLIGLSQQEGEKLLAEGKLALGDVALQQFAEAPGRILGQDPPAGKVVPWKSQVRLVVAQGITVPRLVDLSLDEARQRLRGAQLLPGKIEEIPSYKDWPGTILGQKPGPGVQVALGSQVDLTVARIDNVALVIAIGLLGGLGWLIYSQVVPRPSTVSGLPPNVNIRPGRDSGSQRVVAQARDLTGPDVRLRAVCPEGTYAIKSRGPLVKED